MPTLTDLHPTPTNLRAAVLDGLRSTPRTLPCHLLYDDAGSRLFDRICGLPEYYPTRTEVGIFRDHLDMICDRIGEDALLIELGSGSSTKTEPLLRELTARGALAGYVPIDISRGHLVRSSARIASRFPGLEVMPVCADYGRPLKLPEPDRDATLHPDPPRRVAFFPGSTIGNFHPAEARAFLGRVRELVGPRPVDGGGGGGLLIGVDLRKPAEVLIPAYDDAAGVTAAFNLNLLVRLRAELGAELRLDDWRHAARWDGDAGRVEMHLVAARSTEISLGSERFGFGAGEGIWTESSYKHTLEGFAELAAPHFEVAEVWRDSEGLFSVQWLA